MNDEFETVLYNVERGVGRLTLNRPDRMNGMTNRMVRETHEALQLAAADDSLRVLVLTGAGTSFCPGADLGHFTEGGADERLSPEHFRATTLLHEMPAVTVAAINGACAGAGLGWACACDLRLATRSAKLNTAFLAVAVAGDMGLPWTLAHLVGAAKARELSFLPGKIDAAEAERIGLVTRVFDDDEFASRVEDVVERLASSAPLALRTLKSNYLAAERLGFADYIDLEADRHLRVASSPETAEAFRAFVEKRTPDFGRR